MNANGALQGAACRRVLSQGGAAPSAVPESFCAASGPQPCESSRSRFRPVVSRTFSGASGALDRSVKCRFYGDRQYGAADGVTRITSASESFSRPLRFTNCSAL